MDGALDESNVTFDITSTGPLVPGTPHYLNSIRVNGVNGLMDGVYDDLITPDSVTTNFAVPSDRV